MTTDILEINNFVVLIDSTEAQEAEIFHCKIDEEVIGISFYGSGEVESTISFGDKKEIIHSSKGIVFSFFGNEKVEVSHRIHQSEPLRSINIFSTLKNLKQLPSFEKELFEKNLPSLLQTKADFLLGPKKHLTPAMHGAIIKIFETELEGAAKLFFIKSQVIELLSHYFTSLVEVSKKEDHSQIEWVKEIMDQNIETPPSINELSKMVGINHTTLQKRFKEIFGVPIFKYLQLQRLNKAHQLLSKNELSVKEAAWRVGYESISSFSNAFYKQYGFRPSDVAK
ncbi:helix-turn-helix domain-containing protein [Flammeovirga pacifica]|uniref:HTH araC/xylS-type domain-containing protein n=1 Tax=Flammeovirga pacifica TaxID=915059 RepID=A0A1S1YSK8_FLAPC|nr:AraC family transcriptional regulator [Flammeovirga pacifica]OHX63853.1 hypothetical protein NH26_19770 [Flammeovirga pacifica]